MCDSDEADEWGSSDPFRGKETEAMLPVMLLDSSNHVVSLFATKERREEFHHLRIGAHGGKRLVIGVAPGTK